MDIKQIPQDKSTTYGGYSKVVYATKDGVYTSAITNGWQDEEYATLQAVDALKLQTDEAYHLVKTAQKSPLYFYMLAYRHDIASLAQCSGFFRWQVKRHLVPKIFNKLSIAKLSCYARALNLSIEQLNTLPHDYE